MVKCCSKCKKTKGDDQFNSINFRRKNAVVKTCLQCRLYTVKYSEKRAKPYKDIWNKWKKNPCCECGLMFPHVIEADHCMNRGKKIHMCSATGPYWSRKPMIQYKIELQKCIPLCIMCHRKKTQEVNTIRKMLSNNENAKKYKQQRMRLNKGKELINSHKIGKECAWCERKCTVDNACGFDFDHIDENNKHNKISSMWSYSHKRILEEIKKCQLLCAICHKLKSKYGYIKETVPHHLKLQYISDVEGLEMSDITHDRFFSLQDQCIYEPPQRTPEWFALRAPLSGSKLSNFLFCKDDEERIQWYEEVFEGRPKEPFSDTTKEYMKWGREHEDGALVEFLNKMTNLMAFEAPCRKHSTCDWLSATPDGLYQIYDENADDLVVLEEGIIEIKCPARTKKCNKKVTYYYVPQMFLEMACTGKKKAMFVSWGPKMLRAWKIEWSDEFWRILCNMMWNFKETKNGSDYDSFKLCQFELKRECHKIVDSAVALHSGNGWSLE